MNIQMIKAAMEYTYEYTFTKGPKKGQTKLVKLSLGPSATDANVWHWSEIRDLQNIEDAIAYINQMKDPASLEAELKQEIISHFRTEVGFSSVDEYNEATKTRNLGKHWLDSKMDESEWVRAYEYMRIPGQFNI
jgi:hypothetical protein